VPASIGWITHVVGIDHLAALLTGQPADDADRLVNTCSVAQARLRVMFALEHLVVLDQCFAEQFESPGVALDCG